MAKTNADQVRTEPFINAVKAVISEHLIDESLPRKLLHNIDKQMELQHRAITERGISLLSDSYGNIQPYIFANNAAVPVFEISTSAFFSSSAVNQIHDSAGEEIFINTLAANLVVSISEEENSLFYSMLNLVSETFIENFDTNEILSKVEIMPDKSLKIKRLLINNKVFGKLPTRIASELMNVGIEIVNSPVCNEDEMFLIPEPSAIGTFYSDTLQFSVSENKIDDTMNISSNGQVGMCISDINSITRLKADPIIEVRRIFKKFTKNKNKYRFINK